MPKRIRAPLLERLSPRTDFTAPNGCWVWLGAKSTAGYGQIRYQDKTCYVHRLAYVELVGPLDPAKELDHLCRVRACWNPLHLEQVIHAENCQRGEGGWPDTARQKGQATNRAKAAARTHCGNGHLWTPENTYSYPKKRVCKTCLREQKRQWRARRSGS